MILCIFSLISFVTFKLCVAQEFIFPICHRDSANHSTCLRDAIQEAWPKICQGLPEFNLSSLDPWILKSFYVTFNNDILNINTELHNGSVIGMKNSRFLSVKTYFADDIFQIEMNIHLADVLSAGFLKIIGFLGPFKLNNAGNFNVNMTNIKEKWIIRGHVANDRWNVEHFDIFATVGRMKLHWNSMLSKEFDKVLNDFLNEYWSVLFRSMQSTMLDAIRPLLLDIVNSLFSNISFSKVFPK